MLPFFDFYVKSFEIVVYSPKFPQTIQLLIYTASKFNSSWLNEFFREMVYYALIRVLFDDV